MAQEPRRTDDTETLQEEVGDRHASPRPTPYGDDGTTLTGESETTADASVHDLVEPAGEREPTGS